MRLEWDEAKNRTNLRKHGFHFADAAEMFDGPFLARPDTREDYREERWIGVGHDEESRSFCGIHNGIS
ncbi:MAG TPA: BrnT family toxin [Candidatus Sulfotelmatobacter sp.]|nr:BrnT family toxin [Candidatus Sulfotelmatobacter sp.]